MTSTETMIKPTGGIQGDEGEALIKPGGGTDCIEGHGGK